MLGGSSPDPDHVLVNAAITLASGASENVRRLNANYTTLQSNIVDVAESYIQLSHKLQEAELRNERLSGMVNMLLEKEDEREERWEKQMNLCVFGEFDRVVENYRKEVGPSKERELDGTEGYKFSPTDRWGRKSDEVFRDLMEIMGCSADYSNVHVKRYPIPSKTKSPQPRRQRPPKGILPQPVSSQNSPDSISEQPDQFNRINSQLRSLSISETSPSSPISDFFDPGPAPPCVLVLTMYSAYHVKAAILDAYLNYEKKYKAEHGGKKPLFNIREDRTHKEHLAIKKNKMEKATRKSKDKPAGGNKIVKKNKVGSSKPGVSESEEVMPR